MLLEFGRRHLDDVPLRDAGIRAVQLPRPDFHDLGRRARVGGGGEVSGGGEGEEL